MPCHSALEQRSIPIALKVAQGGEGTSVFTINMAGKPLSAVIQEVEKAYFSHVMTETGGNKAAAARLSGLADDTFRKKIKRYNPTVVFLYD